VREAEVRDHAGDVVAEYFVAERTVDVRSVAVALEFDRDDLAIGCQVIQKFAEHTGQAEAAMNHDERVATTAAFPVEVDLVYKRVPGRWLGWHPILLRARIGFVDIGLDGMTMSSFLVGRA
jgi:hypothetical protein